MIKLINFDVVTKFHFGYIKVCRYFCVTIRTCVTNIVFQKNFILVRHLSKIMFDNLRGKKKEFDKVYLFLLLLFLFLSLSNYYY